MYLIMDAAAFLSSQNALLILHPLGKILTDFARTELSLRNDETYRGFCLEEEGN